MYHTTRVRTFSWCCWHVTFSETRVIYFYAYSVTHDIPEATAAPDTLSLSKVVFKTPCLHPSIPSEATMTYQPGTMRVTAYISLGLLLA